jgi:predicted nucleic acid-binding protein
MIAIEKRMQSCKFIFLDTAPIIYYIEDHEEFGPVVKSIVNYFTLGNVTAFSSVITLTEVLPQPIAKGKAELANQFIEFLRYGKNILLLDITADIAEKAGRFRAKYPFLKNLDALQLACAVINNSDAFVTNDKSLKRIDEIEILLISDFLL